MKTKDQSLKLIKMPCGRQEKEEEGESMRIILKKLRELRREGKK